MLGLKHNYSQMRFLSAILLLLILAFSGATAHAKTVSDINHKGFTGKHPRSKMVDWKPIKTKCEKCTKMVEQYNAAAQQLLNSRYWVNFWRSVHKNREAGKKDPFWPGPKDAGISEFEGKAVGANLQLMESQSKQLEIHKQAVVLLEQQLSYLRAAILECERTQCQLKKTTKIKAVKIGGDTVKAPFSPDAKAISAQYGIDWQGPYSTHCRPCQPFASQLNALPQWVVKADMRLKIALLRLQYAREISISNNTNLGSIEYRHPDKSDYSDAQQAVDSIRAELSGYKKYFESLLKKLSECERKMCKPPENEEVSYLPDTTCPAPAAHTAITVGANAEVGSKANFKQKTKQKAAGLAGKAITGLLGIGGGGSRKAEGPGTYKDPVKNSKKLKVKSRKPSRELRTGAIFTQDGLLVSSTIKKAPGKGTFQTIYLENQRGWRLTPIALYMYEIWQDWKLSVSWTRDTYVNGQHVKHEEGGWTESWRELIAQGQETIYGEVATAPLWEQLGFNTAVSGARSIGTLFAISPSMLADEPINLVIHVTQPKTDPVITVPYVFELSLGKKGRVQVKQVDKTAAATGVPCVEKTANASPQNPPQPADQAQHQSRQAELLEDKSRAVAGDASAKGLQKDQQGDQANGDRQADDDQGGNQPEGNNHNGRRGRGGGGDDSPPLATKAPKDPCTNECKDLLKVANDKAAAASRAQASADAAKQAASDTDNAAKQAEAAADQAEEMAKDVPRDDHAIIDGHKYTTADTEYRVMLQGKINAAHRDGKISDAEHERQTKANTNKQAQQERLKNLAELRKHKRMQPEKRIKIVYSKLKMSVKS